MFRKLRETRASAVVDFLLKLAQLGHAGMQLPDDIDLKQWNHWMVCCVSKVHQIQEPYLVRDRTCVDASTL